MAEEWISLREFGRRRGVALSAVQKAIESGRVTAVKRDQGGRLVAIEANQATIQWNTNTDPAEAAKSGKVLGDIHPASDRGELPLGESVPGAASAVPQANTDRPATVGHGAADAGDSPAGAVNEGKDKDQHGYYAARAERERLTVDQQRLEYLKALGLLVSKAEIAQLTSRRYRAIRDRLLNIPDRLAAVLAAERDAAQVHALLAAELKRVLHELSDDARAEAARGTAERLAA